MNTVLKKAPWQTRLFFAAQFLGLTLLYVIVAKLSLRLAFVNASATPVWPPTGIAVAAVLILGPRALPAIFLGAFLTNATTAGTVATSLGIALGNMLEAGIGAYLIRRWIGKSHIFKSPRNIFLFTIVGMIAAAVSATVGFFSLHVGELVADGTKAIVWVTWWLGDAGGFLIVAPLVLLWARRWPWRWNSPQGFEALGLLVFTVAMGELTFNRFSPLATAHYPMTFLIIPFLIWAALRFGPTFTATTTALFAARAIVGTLQGLGPFALYPPSQSLLLLQSFLMIGSLMALILAAARDQRQHAYQLLEQERSTLAQRVEEETQKLSETLLHLQQREKLLQEAEQIAHLGSWEWIVSQDKINWSPELYRIFGVKPTEFESSYAGYLQYLHPEDREQADEVIQTAFVSHAPFDFIHRIIRPTGEIRTLRGRGRVETDSAGKVTRMLGTAQDITDQPAVDK